MATHNKNLNQIKMKIETILKQNDLTPSEKLILIDMVIYPAILPYTKTSSDIAASIKIKQKEVKIALATLEEKGVIKTEVGYRTRTTKLTKEFDNLLKWE